MENAIASILLSLPSNGNAAVTSLGKKTTLHCLERKCKPGVSGFEEAAQTYKTPTTAALASRWKLLVRQQRRGAQAEN